MTKRDLSRYRPVHGHGSFLAKGCNKPYVMISFINFDLRLVKKLKYCIKYFLPFYT